MNPATLQLITTIVGALIIASILALAKWVTGKVDKVEFVKMEADLTKMEAKLEAALLVVGAAITKPELADRLLTMTGRIDDRMVRVLADIVQLSADAKANFKAISETDKKLDDIPSRVRSLEENQKRNS